MNPATREPNELGRPVWLKDLVAGAVVFIASLIAFAIAAPMDPEPYHDGSQLPAAIAVSKGMVVHRDVFSGYGFITAWLQGAAVELFGPRLIVIRMFTAVLIAVVTVLMYVLARKARLSIIWSAAVALLWVAAWPGRAVIWGTPLLPWPSVVYLVFQLGALLVFLRALTSDRLLTDDRRRTFAFATMGALTALAVLTRLNYGAAFTLALVISLAVFARSRSVSARHWLAAIGGGLAGAGIPLIVVAAQGAFPAFIDQSIVGPLQGKAIVKPTEWFYYENAYLYGSSLLLITVLATLWLATKPWLGRRTFKVGVGLAALGLTIWATTAIDGSLLRNLILTKLTWAPAMDGQAMQPLFLAVIWTILFAITIGAVLALRAVRRQRATGSPDQVLITTLALTGLASLVQLFPVADPNHLWWAAPIPLVLLVYGLTITAPERARWAVPTLILVPSLVVSVATSVVYLQRPRTEITTGTLAGMRIDSNLYPSVLKVDRLLADVEPHSAAFECAGGLLAVWNGEYLASGPGYVDYAYGLDRATPPSPASSTFRCVPWGQHESAPSDAEAEGFRVVQRSGEVALSYFTYVDILELVAN